MSSQTNNDVFRLENLFNVRGRVALITGGGSGIGLMAAQALAVNGAKVYITGRTLEKLDQVVKSHGQNITGEIIPLQADVTDKQSITKLVSELESREPQGLGILINNAGIAGPTHETEVDNGQASSLKKHLFDNPESTFEAWSDVYRTNASSIFFLSTALLPLLQKHTENNHGFSSTILNIASISGSVKSAQHHFQYNASKAAALHITKLLAAEIAKNKIKIRVNAISPGVFPSEMTADESDDKQKSHIEKEKFEGKVPADRPGKDEDMGSAVLFAATNQYLNGVEVVVDGGYIINEGK
ncbi:MAG: hypothetical protein GOMPHAMPRED_008150 [Gomphillus americanus]|uniref:Uncharacterized protein n=1 Tax=Gomphillus americanus TaxID=1940652 RepID=A0A8H3II07_9LECA|nr:MAG: hypothetical protein GOMPHAMPRED_008150 [Gomphillus americanus]